MTEITIEKEAFQLPDQPENFSRVLATSSSPFLSPLIALLEQKHRPDPLPACATCPASFWYSDSHTLTCFCQAIKFKTYAEDVPPVMACDGREIAIAKYEEQMAKQAAGI